MNSGSGISAVAPLPFPPGFLRSVQPFIGNINKSPSNGTRPLVPEKTGIGKWDLELWTDPRLGLFPWD